MADITMCIGNLCPNKDNCYRFTATANPYRQSMFAPDKTDNPEAECNHFWENDKARDNDR